MDKTLIRWTMDKTLIRWTMDKTLIRYHRGKIDMTNLSLIKCKLRFPLLGLRQKMVILFQGNKKIECCYHHSIDDK